jgi:serine protease Do
VLSERGAVVYRVSDRVRDEIGVQAGDVIVQINRTRIATAAEVSEAMEFYGRRGFIQMLVERHGRLYRTEFRI